MMSKGMMKSCPNCARDHYNPLPNYCPDCGVMVEKPTPIIDEPSLIIHNKCGLPVELCVCPDARVKYDGITDTFIDSQEGES